MELYLNPNWSRIGISISGGADSTILAYLICCNTDAEIHFTTQVRMWRTRPWQEHIVDQVINWFQKRFHHNFYVHKNLIPPELEEPRSPQIEDEYGKLKSGNRIILRSHNEYIAKKYKLDAIYVGLNKNPDIKIDQSLDDRNEARFPPIFFHDEIAICHPFVSITKDIIIEQYYKNNVLDLLELTRSCEGEFKEINYKTYKPGQHVPICGECFWCKEREWALNRVEK